MRMLFNIVVICIATWIVTAEANISAVTVVKPTLRLYNQSASQFLVE